MIILPRQARDKHRGSTQKECCVSVGTNHRMTAGPDYLREVYTLYRCCEKRLSFFGAMLY